ncbi:MAG: 16S rRNA (guanine(527)-N(7))-methyltransferase RsmG [Deltaproteobacteria bacterium]|jgi:16S rRNA (guanine527-N7)-methyltransferase|nr:16S rRNA (guanine(527)-N(7))-methyltransferase RsmG [Deltaproteobacteria bacterium]
MDFPGRREDDEAASLILSEFKLAGLALEPLELERFLLLDRTLRRLSDRLDLTRIKSPRAIVVKHYLDSVLAAGLMEPKGVLMDLGSGAGFPGLPMAIMRPGWRILLAEPRRRRLEFMEEVIDLLGLQNVEVFPHKVTASFPGQVESIVARDFGTAADILALAATILPPGGRVYLMKGRGADRELDLASSLPSWGEFEYRADDSYALGTERLARRLITLVRGGPLAKRHALLPRRRVTEIASPMNPRFKAWLKLLDGRNIRKAGEAIASGGKMVPELLARGQANSLLAIRKSDYEELDVPEGIEIFHLRPEIFVQLDIFGTGPPLLVIPAPAPAPWDPAAPPAPGVSLFVPFQDPANVGAVIRSAAALGAGVVLLREAANPFHPKALRASGPAIFQTAVMSGPPLAELPAIDGLFALSARGRDIRSFTPPRSLGLVLGLEGPGLDRLFGPDRRLAIPMRPGVESLNAAAAAAIAMALVRSDDFGDDDKP